MNVFWPITVELVIQILIAFGGTTALVTLIAYAFKNVLLAWISRQFLEQNTLIVEKAKQSFTHALEDHRTILVRSLEDYKLGLNRSLEDYKTKLSADLANQVEPLRASLSRDNIGFQVTHTEYVKRQFLRVEELYSFLLEAHRSVMATYNTNVDITEEQVKATQNSTYEKIRELSTRIHVAALFLPDTSVSNLFGYIQQLETLTQIYEGFWDAAQLVKDKSYGENEHRDTVEHLTIEKNNYQDQKKVVRGQFQNISKDLRTLMSASAHK